MRILFLLVCILLVVGPTLSLLFPLCCPLYPALSCSPSSARTLSCLPCSARCRHRRCRSRHRWTSLSFLAPHRRRPPPAPPVAIAGAELDCPSQALVAAVRLFGAARCRRRRLHLRISPSKPPFIELRHPASRPAPLPILSSASTPAPVRSDAFFSFLLLR